MRNLVLTIGLLILLALGASCGGTAATVDVDQQQAAAQEDGAREASWGSGAGSGI